MSVSPPFSPDISIGGTDGAAEPLASGAAFVASSFAALVSVGTVTYPAATDFQGLGARGWRRQCDERQGGQTNSSDSDHSVCAQAGTSDAARLSNAVANISPRGLWLIAAQIVCECSRERGMYAPSGASAPRGSHALIGNGAARTGKLRGSDIAQTRRRLPSRHVVMVTSTRRE